MRAHLPQGRNKSIVVNTNYPPQNSSAGSGGAIIIGDQIQITLPPLGDETYSDYHFKQIKPGTAPTRLETFYPLDVIGTFGPGVLQSEFDIKVYNDFVDTKVPFDNFDAKFVNESDDSSLGLQGIDWTEDGLTALICQSNFIQTYPATTPRDPSTINWTTPKFSYDTTPESGGISIRSVSFLDGRNKIGLTSGGNDDTLYIYDLAITGDLSTISFDGTNFVKFTPLSNNVRGMDFAPSGLSGIFGDIDNDQLIQWNFDKPFRANTVNNLTTPKVFSLTEITITPRDLVIASNRKTLFLVETTDDMILQFEMSEDDNLDTIRYTEKAFNLTSQGLTSPSGIAISPDDTSITISDLQADRIFKYQNKIATDPQLTFERVKVDTVTGDYQLIVNIPQLVDLELIQILGGKVGAADLSNPNGTWQPQFKSVKHLADIVSGEVFESTNQTDNGTTSSEIDIDIANTIPGALIFNEGDASENGHIHEVNIGNYPYGTTAKTHTIWATSLANDGVKKSLVAYGTVANDNAIEISIVNQTLVVSYLTDEFIVPAIFTDFTTEHKIDVVQLGDGPNTTHVYIDGNIFPQLMVGVGDLVEGDAYIASDADNSDHFARAIIRERRLQNIVQSAETIKIDYNAGANPDTFWHTVKPVSEPSFKTGEDVFLVDNNGNDIVTSAGSPDPPAFDLESYQYKGIKYHTNLIGGNGTSEPRNLIEFEDKTGRLLIDHVNLRIIETKYVVTDDITNEEFVAEYIFAETGMDSPNGFVVTLEGSKIIVCDRPSSVLFQYSLPNGTLEHPTIVGMTYDGDGNKKTLSVGNITSLTKTSDDTKLFVLGDALEILARYTMPNPGLTLGIAFNPDTDETLVISSIDNKGHGISLKPDGSKIYFTGEQSNVITQIDLINNESLIGAVITAITSDTLPFTRVRGIAFSKDGRKVRLTFQPSDPDDFTGIAEMEL